MALAAGVVLAGCGPGAGDAPEDVRLRITEDFGDRPLRDGPPRVEGEDSVLRLLQRNARVGTAFGGGFVQSIDGRSGGDGEAGSRAWTYAVNGLLADRGAADVRVRDGDDLWWDLQRYDGGPGVPARVGAFPEPLRSGDDGRRLGRPVVLRCAAAPSAACREAGARLRAAGVDAAAPEPLEAAAPDGALRVLVGPWRVVRADPSARAVERGVRSGGGVHARPSASGGALRLLDERGRTASSATRWGLVAAVRRSPGAPTWLVTGRDAGGTLAAARTLTAGTLRGRFAVAVAGGRTTPLPRPVGG